MAASLDTFRMTGKIPLGANLDCFCMVLQLHNAKGNGQMFTMISNQ